MTAGASGLIDGIVLPRAVSATVNIIIVLEGSFFFFLSLCSNKEFHCLFLSILIQLIKCVVVIDIGTIDTNILLLLFVMVKQICK